MDRTYWKNKIIALLRERSILWLSGVRRAGKTTLAKSIDHIEYFDCELPRIREQLEDPERFLKKIGPRTIVLDEVHRLVNPSEILKIAADHFPQVKIIATGSSTRGLSGAEAMVESHASFMVFSELDEIMSLPST